MKRLPLLLFSVLLSGCFLQPKTATPPAAGSQRQIINALPFKDRPFVALFPHSTNKLITLFVDKPGVAKDISVDIEYLSGNALKGGRTSISSTTSFPYTQAFLLGSCSSGGKCSFDTDITTGTIKTKLSVNGQTHVLKSNYAFVNGEASTSDQKVSLKVTGKTKTGLILGQSHGFISSVNGEVAAEPVVITAGTGGKIIGTLTLTAPGASKLVYYDGSAYQPLPTQQSGDQFTTDLNHQPWSKDVTIIRDDLKGASETTTLYFLGPIVPLK